MVLLKRLVGEQSYRHFRNALIEAITVPRMDVSINDPAWFRIVFTQEAVTAARGDNSLLTVAHVTQKTWLCCNFRLRVGDLPCSNVSTIDSFTIARRASAGAFADAGGTDPTRVAFPNLTIAVGAADVKPWQDWFNDFVVAGNSGPDNVLSRCARVP
jgi:hypothetical protein